MYLPTLSDKELLVYAEQTQHDLTTSDLERELTKRLSAAVDNDLLEVLTEEGIDDPDELRNLFENIRALKEKAEELL